MTTAEYNEQLSRKWFVDFGLDPAIKPVSEQVSTIAFQWQRLYYFGYNPSLIRFQNRLLMAYRYHRTGNETTGLAIAEFDPQFNCRVNKPVKIPDSQSAEDPKLFVHAGQLWIVWVSSVWPTSNTCVVRFGKLIEGTTWNATEWTVEQIEQPDYGTNDWSGAEKNWVPFQHGGKLHFFYRPGKVITKQGETWTAYQETVLPSGWRYGEIKGGTAPIKFKDKWVRFCHSTLDNEPAPWRRRYYILAVLMEPEPPFQVITMSKEPIVIGSENGRVKQSECKHFKGCVVFVSGAIAYQGGALLSLGVNDSEIVLAHIKEEGLKL